LLAEGQQGPVDGYRGFPRAEGLHPRTPDVQGRIRPMSLDWWSIVVSIAQVIGTVGD
jgi:hypothetical protein